MLNLTTEEVSQEKGAGKVGPEERTLKRSLLEKIRSGMNRLWEAERDEFLGRGRHELLEEEHDNYRHGYRPRRIYWEG